MRPRLRITTMGRFEVERDGTLLDAVDFERQKARALLAALICAGEPVHRELLLDWFWGGLAPDRGLRCLHTALHSLRRALEPWLRPRATSTFVWRGGDSYRLELDDRDRWDGGELLRAARDQWTNGATAPLHRLERIEALCAGSFLPEWPYEEWTQRRRCEIEEASRTVIERLAGALVASGRPAEAIPRYRRLLSLEPGRESWHRGIMQAYRQAGELGLAIRQYEICRTFLRRTLGSEPGEQTRALLVELLR
jgi:DNA-binding SARP family transcriptional activator